MSGQKTSAKSSAKTPELRTPAHGKGKLLTGGVPGHKGGGGRPRKDVIEFWKDQLDDPEVQEQIALSMKDRKEPAFVQMIRTGLLYVKGVPRPTPPAPGDAEAAVILNVDMG